MVMGSWLIEKLRSQQQKVLESKVDREFGEGTFRRLEKEKDSQKNGGGDQVSGESSSQ